MKLTKKQREVATENGFEVVQSGKITKLAMKGSVWAEMQTGKFEDLLAAAIEAIESAIERAKGPEEIEEYSGQSEVDEEGEGTPKKDVVPKKYRDEYRARGNPRNCGDDFAKLFAEVVTIGKVIDEEILCDIGAKNDINVNQRWGTRNIGMRRMNLGNMLRNKLKKGENIGWPNDTGFLTPAQVNIYPVSDDDEILANQ